MSSKHRLNVFAPTVVLSRKEKLKLDLLQVEFSSLAHILKQNKKLLKQIMTKCGFKVIFEIAEERYRNTLERRDEHRKGFTEILEIFKERDVEATRSAFRGLRLCLFRNKRPTINRDLHVDYFNTVIRPQISIADFRASRANSFKAYDEIEELSTSDLFAGDMNDFYKYFMALK